MKIFFVALIAFALLFGCAGEQKAGGSSFGPVNGSNFEGKYAKEGDTVQADYTLMLENGSILDSSNAEVALNAGVYQYGKQYAPSTFMIKHDNGYLEKFTYSFVGMYEGQTKRITLLPEEAYGRENESKVISAPRCTTEGRYVAVPLSAFTEKKIDVQVNSTINPNPYWSATVVEIRTGSSEVLIRHNPNPGQVFGWYGVPVKMVDVTNETYTYCLEPEVGQIYQVPDPVDMTKPTRVTARSVGNETVLFDYNHPLAGKTLVFDIELLKIAGG